ncbi:hypothetical protein COMNV_00672 [Commensalibacter sp. Nvir]|uniref:TetR family transcriptional regulator n=1 Tax=Commensalibacter sp. Nvir TaxID=3069817 RepID=UPI002D53D2E0|nr:hypothetical protein COMNV_00672 [Commensalibacter sp. Nvir]
MRNKEINKKILQQGMLLFAKKGWDNTTLVQIAEYVHLPVYQVRKNFPFKICLLIYLNQLVDKNTMEQPYQGQRLPEYLFDAMMNRFDILQQYREGYISIVKLLPSHPSLALLIGFGTQRSMKWIAESARINTMGFKGFVCIEGLTAIWTVAFKTWLKDTTHDLSRTMASLDKTITKAGKLAPYVVVRQKSFSNSPCQEYEKETHLLTNENKS